jgi:hypothetical protein
MKKRKAEVMVVLTRRTSRISLRAIAPSPFNKTLLIAARFCRSAPLAPKDASSPMAGRMGLARVEGWGS